MRKVKSRLQRRLSLLLALVMLLTSLSGIGVTAYAADNTQGFDQSFNQRLEQLRGEFARQLRQPRVSVPQIHVDTTGLEHRTPIILTKPAPSESDAQGVAPLAVRVPYGVGAQRTFNNPYGGLLAGIGTLRMRGQRVNVWTMDDNSVTVNQAMVDHFDHIVESIENSTAPFGGIVYTPSNWGMIVGDVQGDGGRINVLIHNQLGGAAGMFNPGDYDTAGGNEPLPLVHVASGFIGDPLSDVIFAHEVQHLLFYQYFGVYASALPPAVQRQLAWFNESMSELVDFLFANPGSETIDFARMRDAAAASYVNPGDARPGDFLNFNDSLKNYGMGKLFGILMHRFVGGSPGQSNYLSRVYNYFSTTLPLATDSTGFNSNVNYIENNVLNIGVNEIYGNALNAAGVTMGAPGVLGLWLTYDIFMFNFSADGGDIIHSSSIDQTTKFIPRTFSAYNLWGLRPNLGLPNSVFDEIGSIGLDNFAPLPILNSGETVTLVGVNNPENGATREAIYRLTGESAAASTLRLSINDPEPATLYTVVVPNDAPGSISDFSNQTLGANGATVHSLESRW